MERTTLLRFVGSLLFILGIALVLSLNSIVKFIVNKEMALYPGSRFFEMWQKTFYPIRCDIYLFNCTNSAEFVDEHFVPELEQLGPYRFNEYQEKRNITWNDNHTVTYEQFRYWYFDAENSNGSLDDICTSLNPMPLTVSYMSRNWSRIISIPLSATLQSLEKSIWSTKTVREMLFQGYSDPALTLANSLPTLGVFKLPADKIGYYYKFNGTSKFDGTKNIHTGQGDLSKKGTVLYWNYENRSGGFEDHCGDIVGTTGEIVPPGLTADHLDVFIVELCRSVKFDYVDDTEVLGIPGRRYVLNNSIYDNGTSDPDTECSCGGQCLRQGVLNISSCFYGAPVFSSRPHFMDADPYYRQRLKGMKPDPDPELHGTYSIVEPMTGAPIQTVAQLQANFLLQKNPKITMFKNVPDVMFPAVLFRKEWRLNQDLAALLRLVVILPAVGFYFAVAISIIGVLMVMFTMPPSVIRRVKKAAFVKDISSALNASPTCFSLLYLAPYLSVYLVAFLVSSLRLRVWLSLMYCIGKKCVKKSVAVRNVK